MKKIIFIISIILTVNCRYETQNINENLINIIQKAISNLNIEGSQSQQIRIKNEFIKALQLGFKVDNYSSITDSLLIDIFETEEKYIFIRFKADLDNNKIALFQIHKHTLKLIFEETIEIGFSNSYVKDINGDQYFDVIHSFYAPSGCCLRNLATVRLYNPIQNDFEQGIDFMNPTFDPKNHLVRGIQYGQAGQVPIYKFKWQNLQLDTIEYIYPISGKQGQFFIMDKTLMEKRKVNELPKEYKEIEDINWFLNDFE